MIVLQFREQAAKGGFMAVAEKELFFDRMREMELALTYDDVRLRTGPSLNGPLPRVLDIESRFSEHVGLKVPFVSAAMDTVTTAEMAIAMAKLGGLGIIHAAMDIDIQRKEVRSVKKGCACSH
jgi:IMP dehydrogenase/GMP reductase